MPGGGGVVAAATRQRRKRANERNLGLTAGSSGGDDRDPRRTSSQDSDSRFSERSERRARASSSDNGNTINGALRSDPSPKKRKHKRPTNGDATDTDDGNETNDNTNDMVRLPGVQAYLNNLKSHTRQLSDGSFASAAKEHMIGLSSGNADDDGDEGTKASSSTSDDGPIGCVNSFREFCGMVVNDSRVQLGIILLILVNALFMGLGTFNFVVHNHHVQQAFQSLDKAFLIIFTIEISLQFVYLGPIKLVMDPWLVFDAFIVVTSWSLEGLQIVRAFRIFRAFRLIARLTILRNLANAIFKVLPNMAAIAALLTLVLYIYSVLCTVLFHDLYERGLTDEDYFSRLDITFLTLLEIMTLGWADIVRQVQVVYWWAWMPFVSFILISAFIVYNLVVAVVCDAVTVVEQESKQEELEKEQRTMQQQRSYDEFRPTSLREQQERQLQSLQLKVSRLIQTQQTMLQTLEATLRELETNNETPAAKHT